MALRSLSFDSAADLQAFAASAKEVLSAAVVVGGTLYTLNDILTVVGGVGEFVAKLKVTGVAVGVITTVSVEEEGAYTTAPTNPVSVTGGTGLGATFNLTLGNAALQTDILSVEIVDRRWYLLYWV